jgi:2-methylisocitrate lyase-like PEP mutase family enzyme
MLTSTLPSSAYTRVVRGTSRFAAAFAAIARVFREIREETRAMQLAAHHDYPYIGL